MAELQRSLDQTLVVVTGGFGQAGGAIARAAKAAGAKVAVIDRGDPPPALDFDHVEARLDLGGYLLPPALPVPLGRVGYRRCCRSGNRSMKSIQRH